MVLESKLKQIKKASRALRLASAEVRNAVLKTAAELLRQNETKILTANQKDLKLLSPQATASFRDRLTLNSDRISQMANSLKQVAELPDPLIAPGEVRILDNGLELRKARSPLGVIFMIFESRPNVAVEAFSMGFKSGNAMILRGGRESIHTVAELYRILQAAVRSQNLPKDILWGITDPDRKIVSKLLRAKEFLDVVVPRGGEKLIEFVQENSLIPIIKNDRGLCHVYIHEDADLDMATSILVNAKTQRPGVCNSMETILVHEKVMKELLPKVYGAMEKFGVQWFGCPKTRKILKGKPHLRLAREKNWNTEYLDQIVNCKAVDGLAGAIAHIEKYSSRHSEAIVTQNIHIAQQFQNEVDSAVVYWNASTRFTDGYEFGLGGELGISTQKLHVRGPVGLQALTNERWVVNGHGQIRK